ncbi:hypothetical protein AAFN88_07075 [Pelagibius sp. CAU 1746]|uniref:hypothetical protein n=1 Tax=Pelagibius sp. CAU 1746 TaxID=3140370 RepID=UPI00325B19AD
MTEQISDPQIWQQLRQLLPLALLALALLAWLVIIVSALCIPFNAVPGTYPKVFSLRNWFKPDSFQDWMLLNRLNVIFYSDLLTPRGRFFRKCLFAAVATFVMCIVLFFFLLPPERVH